MEGRREEKREFTKVKTILRLTSNNSVFVQHYIREQGALTLTLGHQGDCNPTT